MKTSLPSSLSSPYSIGFLVSGTLSILWVAYCLIQGWYWQTGVPLGILLGATALVNERLVFYLLCLSLPFSLDMKIPGSGVSLSAPAEPLIGLLAGITLFRLLLIPNAFRLIKHPVTLIIFCWWGWQWSNVFFSEMPLVSLKWMLVQTAFIIVFYLMPAWMEERQQGIVIKAWLLFGTGYALLEIYTTWKHSTLAFARFTSMESVFPFFNDHTLYGTCGAFILGILSILLFNARKSSILSSSRILLLVLVCFIPVAIFLSFSRASWFSTLTIPLILCLLKWKITPSKVLIALSSVSVVLLLSFSIWYPMLKQNDNDSKKKKTNLNEQLKSVTNISSDLSNMERLNRWSCAIRMSADKPVTGFGPGTYQFQYIPYQKPSEMTWISMSGYRVNQDAGKGGTAHSEYLLQASESGWVVVALYITTLFLLFHYGFKVVLYSNDQYSRYTVTAALCGLSTFIFHSSFNNFLDQSKAAFLFWSCAAMIVIAHHKLKHHIQNDVQNFSDVKH